MEELVQKIVGQQVSLIRELNSEKDRNFLFETSDKRLVVVKVFNPRSSREQVELMVDVMQASEKSVNVPKIIAWNDTPCLYMMSRFVEGETLSRSSCFEDEEALIKLCSRIGVTVGRLSKSLESLEKKSRENPLIWNLKNFDSVVADSQYPELANRISGKLIPNLRLNEQLCHYDLNDDNIIVGEEIGIIDFGDVDVAPRITDIAICLCYILINLFQRERSPGLPFIKRVVQSVLGNYRCVVDDTTEAELDLCATIVIARALMSLSIQSKNRAENPENAEYLSVSDKGCHNMLLFLSSDDLCHTFCDIFKS